MSENSFHLQAQVDALYHESGRRFAFIATTPDHFHRWQAEFRRALYNLLGIAERPLPEIPAVTPISSRDKGAYIEEKYALDVGDVLAPMFLLIPKTPPPYVPVIAFHGHGSGVASILEKPEHQLGDNNFAERLAQDGYLVCAIEQRGFGERITDQVNEGNRNSCRHLTFEYLLNGRTLLGERVADAMVAVNYLKQRQDVVFDSLASVGFSGGGATALFLSALDERITSTLVSSYFCSFKQSILSMSHCECNYVPGILQLAEMGDIATLIAPRNLGIVTGEHDPLFPIQGVYEQFKTVEQAYEVLNRRQHCSLLIHEGGHAHHHDLCRNWLAEQV